MVDIFSAPQQCEKLIWTKSSQEWNRKYWPLRPPVISDLYPASWHACHWRRMMSDLKSHDLTSLSCGSWSLCSVMGMGDVPGMCWGEVRPTCLNPCVSLIFLFHFLAQTSRRRPSLQSLTVSHFVIAHYTQRAVRSNGLWFLLVRLGSPRPHANTHGSPSPAVYSAHLACVCRGSGRSSTTKSSFVNLSSRPVVY